ncbi:MAG: serine/threonine protein kinase [Actinomycetota bacterium]|nr:serine/threonine protein kinase [Actinomycetota bacterium]
MSAPDASALTDGERQLGGRYRLVHYIAKGGMAEVWEGYDAVLSRPVAVKILLAHLATDNLVLERFRREAVTAARLAHPGVIATYDTGVDHGTAWIVMELVRGRTLRHLMTEHGRMDPALAVRIAGQITDALAHAHKAGLVHRDVKPGNVLLCDEEGLVPRAKVTDFGIAKATESLGLDLTRTGIVLGTPKYLSPEQVEGIEPDARADLYSLGVVIFEMLTGQPPFSGPTDMATALSHLRDPPPHVSDLRPDIPEEIDEIVDGLLVKDREQRTPSAVALRQQLASAARHLGAGQGQGANGAATDPARTPVISGGVGTGTALRWSNGSTHADVAPRRSSDWGPPATAARAASSARQDSGVGVTPVAGTPVAGVGVMPVAGRTPGTRDDRATRVEPVRRPGPARRVATSPASRDDGGRTAPPRRPRRGPGVVVAALVVIGAVVIGVLFAQGRGTPTTTPGTPASGGKPIAITDATEFLLGGHPDNVKELANLYDGNPATAWSTVLYTNSTFGNLYQGLGVVLQLEGGPQSLHRMVITSPSQGWSAQAYVATQPPPAGSPLSAWGHPAGSVVTASGNATLNLGGRSGGYVMLWLTNLGPVQASLGGQAQVKIDEIVVS